MEPVTPSALCTSHGAASRHAIVVLFFLEAYVPYFPLNKRQEPSKNGKETPKQAALFYFNS